MFFCLKGSNGYGEDNVEEEKRVEYTDMQLIPIWNDFVYALFIMYFFILNIGLLVLFPIFFKRLEEI